jgi:hypothetical protein
MDMPCDEYSNTKGSKKRCRVSNNISIVRKKLNFGASNIDDIKPQNNGETKIQQKEIIEEANKDLRHYQSGLKKGDFLFRDDEILEKYKSICDSDAVTVIPGKSWKINTSFKEKDLELYNQAALSSCSYTNVVSAIKSLKKNLSSDLLIHYVSNNSILDDIDRMNLLAEHLVAFDYVMRKGCTHDQRLFDNIKNDFNRRSNGAIPIAYCVEPASKESTAVLDHIREHQDNYLFAIFTIDDKKIGSHSIIVLEADDEGVVLFDPLHGWLIKVTHKAFLLRANKNFKQDIIWIKK